MPFKSKAQRRLFYAKMRRGEISKAEVEKWERETGGRHLPERVRKKAKRKTKKKTTRKTKRPRKKKMTRRTRRSKRKSKRR